MRPAANLIKTSDRFILEACPRSARNISNAAASRSSTPPPAALPGKGFTPRRCRTFSPPRGFRRARSTGTSRPRLSSSRRAPQKHSPLPLLLSPPPRATPSIADVVEALVTQLRDGRLARLRRVVLQVWAEAVRDEELAALARSTLGQLRTHLTQWLERLAAEGRIPSRADTIAAGGLILALLQGYVIQLAVLGDVSPQKVREAAAALFGAC